jgi:predicted secreted Zn-dependent protease
MSDKLAGTEKQVFRDSLVTNATDLCSMLTKLNVTNDPKLEQARQQLEKALIGVDAKELRKHDAVRVDVKARVDEILSMF